MSRSSTTRRFAIAAAAIAAIAAVYPITHAGAAAAPKTENCSLTVIGKAADGQFITTDLTCTTSGAASAGPAALAAASFPIAVHYQGLNFAGSTLTIYGDGCTGGWLNMPSGWSNIISSTYSGCTVDHYDGYNLIPTVQTLFGSGNLTTMDNRTSSALYR